MCSRIRSIARIGSRKYTATGAYAASKLAGVMLVRELERRLAAAGGAAAALRVLSVHPGNVLTDVVRTDAATRAAGAGAAGAAIQTRVLGSGRSPAGGARFDVTWQKATVDCTSRGSGAERVSRHVFITWPRRRDVQKSGEP